MVVVQLTNRPWNIGGGGLWKRQASRDLSGPWPKPSRTAAKAF